MVTAQPRRVRVGTNEDGLSCVVGTDTMLRRAVLPSGAVLHEVWVQEQIPELAASVDCWSEEMESDSSVTGVSIRRLTVPPDVDPEVAAYVASTWDSSDACQPLLDFTTHKKWSMDTFVATVLTGAAYLVLEREDVLLRQGDSVVVPGSMHSWRNPFNVDATMVSTFFGHT